MNADCPPHSGIQTPLEQARETERKRAEETIRLYADIVSNVPIGLTIWRLEDPEHPRSLRLVTANPAASGLLGIDVTSLLGRTFPEAFPGVSETALASYADVVRLGQAKDLGEIHYQDGRLAPNYWTVKAFPLPDRCVGLAFENVTARKRAEEVIRTLNEELERRVEARTAELSEANRDLAEKNQENEMFVYSVSHDLRSPLVNLEGFSQELAMVSQNVRALLADNLPVQVREQGLSLVDRDMAESIRFIQTAVRRLSNIIDALLRLSRAGRVEYQCERVDLKPIVTRVVEALGVTALERGATVCVRDLPPVWGDAPALEQVFANLIGNALNYLDPKRPGLVEVGSDRSPGNGSLDGLPAYYVRDNGLGILEAYQHKVFQAFQRVHPERAKGEGMGLAIVRRIVERHRGTVWVESRPGEGSTFFVALPQPPDKQPAA